MIIIAATIIFIGLVAHASLNHFTMVMLHRANSEHQRLMQKLQQEHDIKFAMQQAEMFKKSVSNYKTNEIVM